MIRIQPNSTGIVSRGQGFRFVHMVHVARALMGPNHVNFKNFILQIQQVNNQIMKCVDTMLG